MLSGPIFGDTLDSADSGITAVVTGSKYAQQTLGRKLTHRICFDPGEQPSAYTSTVNALHPYSYLMGQLVDSAEMKQYSVASMASRAAAYVKAFGSTLDIYEVGNEINGNWLGSDAGQKAYAAYKQVTGAGLTTALTGYYQPSSQDPGKWDMIPWLTANIPADMKAGLHYVFVSYYQVDNGNHVISQAELNNIFGSLHSLFPQAKLGFGEIGLDDAVTRGTLAQAKTILSYYYGLQPTGMSTDLYVRGCFWWYGQEDLFPTTKPLWPTFATAIEKY